MSLKQDDNLIAIIIKASSIAEAEERAQSLIDNNISDKDDKNPIQSAKIYRGVKMKTSQADSKDANLMIQYLHQHGYIFDKEKTAILDQNDERQHSKDYFVVPIDIVATTS
jgi:hypothetical protein